MTTVGLDFGTHQTKICVEKKNRAELSYEFITFKDNEGNLQYTLPSIISLGSDGLLNYGYIPEVDKYGKIKNFLHNASSRRHKQGENSIIRYFKQATFTSVDNLLKHEDAILYSIWYLSYIIFDLEEKFGQDFHIQMGVPTDGERMEDQKKLAVRILISAYRLVEDVFRNNKKAFLQTPISTLKEKTEIVPYSIEKKEELDFLIFPEAYACLMPLINSKKIATGMSLMIDIGGGTTDVSFFTIKDDKPRVYDFYSLNEGLNYLTDAFNKKTTKKDSNVLNESEILKDKKKEFHTSIDNICKELNNRLAKEFRAQCKQLSLSKLWDALKNRPIIYTGGGSSFSSLRREHLGFKDIIPISHKEWKSENVKDMDKIKSKGLCPILSTAYGLSFGVVDDNIKCEPFREIFENARKKPKEETESSRFGKALGGFNYSDDWDAWK